MTRARVPLRTVVAAVSLFVLGGITGVTADRLLHWRASPDAARLAAIREDPVGEIDRAVGLRPDQRARVAAIVENRQAELDDAWHDVHERLQATIDSFVAEIAAVLDPEQAAIFREHVARVHGEPASFPDVHRSR